MGGLKSLAISILASLVISSPAIADKPGLEGRLNQETEITQNTSLEKTVEKLDKNPTSDALPDLDERYNFNLKDLKKYKTWIKETIKHSKENKTYVIIVDKANYSLDLYKNGNLLKTYPIELGFNPYDDKKMRGDGTTPEGKYKVKRILNEGQTSFHKAFLIDYPNKKNWQRFRARKRKGSIPKKARIGGSIEIHGGGSGSREDGYNWTLGCMALSDEDIDEFFPYIKKWTRITIVKYGTRINLQSPTQYLPQPLQPQTL